MMGPGLASGWQGQRAGRGVWGIALVGVGWHWVGGWAGWGGVGGGMSQWLLQQGQRAGGGACGRGLEVWASE